MTESPQDAHVRGVAEGIVQGRIEQRLRGVEEHLVRNNGSIAEQVAQGKQQLQQTAALTLQVQRLVDRDELLKDKVFSPTLRTVALLAIAVAAITVVVLVVVLARS